MSNINPIDYPSSPMILEDDIILASQVKPTFEKDYTNAKLVLQQCSGDTGDTLFDHLSDIIKKVIDENPPNVVDYFEEYSHQIKEERFRMNEAFHEEVYEKPEKLERVKKNLPFLKVPLPKEIIETSKEEEEETETRDHTVNNVMFLQFYWSFAGFGFPQKEVFLLSCSMRRLEEISMIETCSFWGVMQGIQQNYYVVEVKLTDEEIEKRNALIEEREDGMHNLPTHTSQKQLTYETSVHLNLFPRERVVTQPSNIDDPATILKPRPKVAPIPASEYKPALEIPEEKLGEGVNRFVYYVCNFLNEDWVELPNVTPKQINVSRQIKKYLTGLLDEKILSYPTFPGTERNYLRTLIARITSSTHVSPVGFYRIGIANDEEEEEEENEEDVINNDKIISVDETYEPLAINELLSTKSWVHHRPNILKQGRVKWVDVAKFYKPETENEEEEEEGEEEEEAKEEEEFGPILMTPCAEDLENDNISPWTIRLTSICNPKNAMVLIRSNVWPGAFSLTLGKVVSSLYIGFGDKFTTRNYSPPPIPQIQNEYPIGPEILEITDPTAEAEEAWELAHRKREPIIEEGEEEIDEEGEEEEDED